MRLIDADVLNNFIDKWLSKKCDEHGNTTPNEWLNSLKRCVEEQPTAYDVDEVANAVEEITERILNNCDEIELDWPEEERTGYDMNEDVLKIRHLIKYGCIETDAVCEWKQTSTAKYNTSCGYRLEEYFDTKACYCKQCGKKIKVAE